LRKADEKFMQRAIKLSKEALEGNFGGPFGAVITRNDELIAEGMNQVTSKNDPTAHAEVDAIRKACEKLDTFQLDDCMIYCSCEPCPMCLGAIYWARLKKGFFACSRQDAAAIDFDDQFIYDEIEKEAGARKIEFKQMMRRQAQLVFQQWETKGDKVRY
jgi:tRNA(Arg) A34 adenosine deaminase TadA